MTKYSDIHDERFELPEPPDFFRRCEHGMLPALDGSIVCNECLLFLCCPDGDSCDSCDATD